MPFVFKVKNEGKVEVRVVVKVEVEGKIRIS